MQSTADEEFAVIRLQPVAELVPARTELTEEAWAAALAALGGGGRACLPHFLPDSSRARVVTWPTSRSIVGPLLDACRVFVEGDGGQEAAEHVAQEARALKMLTTVPHLRQYRQPAPPPGSSPADVFAHERIGVLGNGFAAVTLAELTAATAGHRKRGILAPAVPAGPSGYVVVWDELTAPGMVMSGVRDAYAIPEHGTALLHQRIHTAVQALTPGPRAMEWQ